MPIVYGADPRLVNLVFVLLGIILVIGAFTYRGFYNRAFARRGRPEIPPSTVGRIILFVGGIIFLGAGIMQFFR